MLSGSLLQRDSLSDPAFIFATVCVLSDSHTPDATGLNAQSVLNRDITHRPAGGAISIIVAR